MDSGVRSIVSIIIIVLVVFLVLRACESTKRVDFKHKSNDQKSTYSVEVQKTGDHHN